MAPNLHVYNDTTFEMRVRALSGRRKREKIGWRRVEAGLTGALLAAACCQALLPVHVDSFSLAAPHTRTTPHAPAEFGSARFGLRLRGGERTPPPGRASASLQACADGGGVAGACSVGPKLFAVEGLIGAGKSTLLAKLRSEQVSPPHVRVCSRASALALWARCAGVAWGKRRNAALASAKRLHAHPRTALLSYPDTRRAQQGMRIIPEPLEKWQETGARPCYCAPLCVRICMCVCLS
jgi:hypothetical protein